MKRLRKWVITIGYVLAVTVFFLYALFPSEAAKDYISGYLSRQYPDYTVTVETIKPIFPPGLKFDFVSIAYRGNPWVELDQFRVRPRYLSVFSAHKTVLFKGTAYSGNVRGEVDFKKAEKGYGVEAAADLSGIKLGEIEHLQTLSGRKVAGVLSSTFGYRDEKGSNSGLNITMHIADCEVGLTNPVFTINNIEFDSVDAELSVDRRSLKLKRCNVAGNQVDGGLSGVILFRNPFEKSRLELKGNVVPHHLLMASLKKVLPESLFPQKKSGDKGYPIRLYGTIEKPKFSLR